MDNTNKNPIFSIKNFRSFGEDGADFELAPITVLTGCNSAGKSSLTKALILLSKQSKKKTVDIDEPGFIITDDPVGAELPINDKELGLGSFKSLINDSAQEEKIEFAYIVPSKVLGESVRVIKTFKLELKESYLNYGNLSGVKIASLSGEQLYGFREDKPDAATDYNYKSQTNSIEEFFYELDPRGFSGRLTKLEEKQQNELLEEVLLKPDFISDIAYVSSSSAQIKRLYSTADDDKVSVALRHFLDRTRSFAAHVKKDGYNLNDVISTEFIDHWIKEFGIGEKIEFKTDEVGLGVYIYLIKENGKKRLLADEGYGITQLFALMLEIANNLPYHDYKSGNKARWICVEEPEVHHHPAFQSKLANMLVDAYKRYNIHFIIETHSEYLIRRLQVMVADKNCPLQPNDISLNYIYKDDAGISHNNQIKIHEDGGLNASLFGKGFFDESNNLAIDLFRLKPILS